MRVILQRVAEARVRVEQVVVGEIGQGWLALVGITHTDSRDIVLKMAEKIVYLRAFIDNEGKMNRSVLDVNGGILVVSNFTLYADCQKGRRPSFLDAAKPEIAAPLVKYFAECLRAEGLVVEEGRFGETMAVELINDGPITFMIDSEAGH